MNVRTAGKQHNAEKAAWMFYTVAAIGSSIGQIWVGVTVPPWPASLPWWARTLLTLPFAIVIDLGGVVASAFADWRQRLGEAAFGWRALSFASAAVAVGINVIGHSGVPYLAVVFGGLGSFAYAVWLLHSAARRRDALRVLGKLGPTAPTYGLVRWIREPAVTRRAKGLALACGLSLYESLETARAQLRAENRIAALEHHIAQRIRDQHAGDPVLAEIAVTTLPADAVAAALTAQADVQGWARTIGIHLRAPLTEEIPVLQTSRWTPEPPAAPPVDVLRRIPVAQVEYDRWRQVWQALQDTDLTNKELAAGHGVSVRHIQWIRAAGKTGLLDSPEPTALRLIGLARTGNAGGRGPDQPVSAPS